MSIYQNPIRLRTAFAYSNMDRRSKANWKEYQATRKMVKALEREVKILAAQKPHFKLVDGQPQAQPNVWLDLIQADLLSHQQRLKDLALDLYKVGAYVAPDFTVEEVKQF